MFTLLLLLACGRPGPVADLPRGTYTLEGAGTRGELRIERRGLSLDLWSEMFCSTPGGKVLVEPREEANDAETWIYAPIETGLGAGEVALGLEFSTNEATMPLGAREGEHLFKLKLQRGALDDRARAEGAAACARRLEVARKSWSAGNFRVLGEARELIGRLTIPPGQAPWIELFGVAMATDDSVEAVVRNDGPDLVLTFPAEPSYRGEDGALRVNIPTGRVVVPSGPDPSPMDQQWALMPGEVSDDEAARAREEASRASIEREREVLDRLGRGLANEASNRRAADPMGACPTLEALGEPWVSMVDDYELRFIPEKTGCAADFKPRTVQHGRRIAGMLGVQGLRDWEALGVSTSLYR